MKEKEEEDTYLPLDNHMLIEWGNELQVILAYDISVKQVKKLSYILQMEVMHSMQARDSEWEKLTKFGGFFYPKFWRNLLCNMLIQDQTLISVWKILKVIHHLTH